MNIVLIGFMCSGKSRIGRLLAERLNWSFIDTDRWVTERVGMPVADIIRTQGEAAFRSFEREAVAHVANLNHTVIATGGGVPLDPDNISALKKKGCLIWLKVSPSVALKRAGDLRSRPLIDSSRPLESVSERLKEREPLYRVADHSIDTDNSNPESTVDQIVSSVSDLKL